MDVSTTSGATVTANWPAGYTAVADDYAVVICAGLHNQTSSFVPGDPSGWGSPLITKHRNTGTFDMQQTIWAKKLTTSEAAASITVPVGYHTTSGGVTMQVAVYRGVDTVTPMDATPVSSDTGAVNTWAAPGITTVTALAWVLSAVMTNDDNGLDFLGSGNAQGFTQVINHTTTTGGDVSVGLAHKEVLTPGAVTAPTWNKTAILGSDDEWIGIALALRPAAGASTLSMTVAATIPNWTVAGNMSVSTPSSGSKMGWGILMG